VLTGRLALAGINRQPQRQAGKHAAHQPALQARPERAPREKNRDRSGGEDICRIECDADRDLQGAKRQGLAKNVA
jgi:hypothetical protein